ncbi:3408_t:CDS:2 [Entrophospora sp. SA101]|nr:3408_t:CDS:2 [Entrophospora sp. SA101]CAJ0824708.1 2888_t:CDS:2 [Entrophospora sp. SA101]
MVFVKILFFVILSILGSTGINGDDIFTGISKAPGNRGAWYTCSDIDTRYVSFAMNIVDSSTPMTPGFIGTIIPGVPPEKPIPKYRPGLIVYQLANSEMQKYLDPTSDFEYVPSLSCYDEPKATCKQDAGKIPLQFSTKQCLLMENPTGLDIVFNVSLSWTKSIFNSDVQSPNVPGGLDSITTTTDVSSATSSSSPTTVSDPNYSSSSSSAFIEPRYN